MPRGCCIFTQVTGFTLAQLTFHLFELHFDGRASPDQAALGFRQTLGAPQVGSMCFAQIP